MPPRPIVLAAVALACGTGFALLPTGTAYAQAAAIESAPPPAQTDAVVRPATAEESPPTASSWYGYQILATDALATFLFFEGVGNNSSGAASAEALGVMMYLGDGAAVHGLHHHPMRSLVSVGLRVSLPIVGALVGAGIAAASPHGASSPYATPIGRIGSSAGLWAPLVGLIAAVVMDDLVLAFDTEPPTDATTHVATGSSSFAIVPTFAFASDRDHGARPTLGIAGSF